MTLSGSPDSINCEEIFYEINCEKKQQIRVKKRSSCRKHP
jgi:hypothetical protein